MRTDDATLLAEELDAQKVHVAHLEHKLKQEQYKVKNVRADRSVRRFFLFVAGVVFGAGLLVGASYLSWKTLNQYDTNQCYIQKEEECINVFMVYRSVEWGSDRAMGYSTDLDKAMEIAKKQGCRTSRRVER